MIPCAISGAQLFLLLLLGSSLSLRHRPPSLGAALVHPLESGSPNALSLHANLPAHHAGSVHPGHAVWSFVHAFLLPSRFFLFVCFLKKSPALLLTTMLPRITWTKFPCLLYFQSHKNLTAASMVSAYLPVWHKIPAIFPRVFIWTLHHLISLSALTSFNTRVSQIWINRVHIPPAHYLTWLAFCITVTLLNNKMTGVGDVSSL